MLHDPTEPATPEPTNLGAQGGEDLETSLKIPDGPNKPFAQWLLRACLARGIRDWTQLSIRANRNAATAGSKDRVTPGAISNIVRSQRNLGPEAARAIAYGLRMPQEIVFRQSNILNDVTITGSDWTRQIEAYLLQIPEEERAQAANMVEVMLGLQFENTRQP